jgi:hypothetical protein
VGTTWVIVTGQVKEVNGPSLFLCSKRVAKYTWPFGQIERGGGSSKKVGDWWGQK